MAEPKLSKIFTTDIPELSKDEAAQLKAIQAVRTTPRDARFPSHNQALHCWNRYNEWVLCDTQGDTDACKPLRQLAESICPGYWMEGWDESREEGTFYGIGSKYNNGKGGAHH